MMTMMMKSVWKISALGLFLLGSSSTLAQEANSPQLLLIQNVIDWVSQKQGSYVNPKLDFTIDGVRANEPIKKDELLLHIPAECIISTESVEDDDDEEEDEQEGGPSGLHCQVVQFLIDEMNPTHIEKSSYAPYLQYLQSLPTGVIPASWSEEGQTLLHKVVGSRLPPTAVTGWSLENTCEGKDDDNEFEYNIAMMLVEHSYEDMMIPLFDMMEHSNGDAFNAEGGRAEPGHPFKVVATKDISADQDVKTSFNLCTQCVMMEGAYLYGTPEIFRDTGTIEPYPQRWIMGEGNIVFEIDEEDDGQYSIEWDATFPMTNGVKMMVHEVQRLELTKKSMEKNEKNKYDNVPEEELAMCKKYTSAALTALTHALKAAKGEMFATISNGYHDLENEDYGLNYHGQEEFPGYKDIDSDASAYQQMEFWHHPTTRDTCFDLDGTVQICGAYRPHYHEMFVHYPARYFNRDIKRIAFIGGGDNMLLHEAIKYPNIELVLGLEIDQKVSRNSFKHFGTQTHFDSDKVQWWYGDAAKSLLMLPKEYFGSFDLVLIDLSETIMALTVTKDLDIFDALGLLLKDDGILVKNEMYLNEFSRIWKHSSMIHYLSPVVGSQALVFGSNKMDFLHDPIKDHEGVENLFMKTLEDTEDEFELLHDYRKNETREIKHCAADIDLEAIPDVQENSPGILMIVEAEDTTVDISTSEALVSVISQSLEKQGFATVSSATYNSKQVKKNSIVVASVTLKEGYVVARSWPEHKYVALDLHLWSSFDKHEVAKKALLEGFGSTGDKSSSSYRIVAGGMFGVDTWKEDAKNRGPRITQDCDTSNDSASTVRDDNMSSKTVESILQDSMALVQSDKIVVLVVCGKEDEACTSAEMVNKASNVDQVVSLQTCADLPIVMNMNSMRACEKTLVERLMKITKDTKIDAIVIDPGAQKRMGQLVHRIFTNEWNQHVMLAQDDTLVVLAPMINGQGPDEMWRRELMDRFRQDVIFDEPVFLADAVFNTTDSTMALSYMSGGDTKFVTHLNELCVDIEKRSNVASDVTYIQGGQWYVPPNDPSTYVLPEAYDQTEPLANWNSQRPVGHQTVFQLEVADSSGDNTLSSDALKKAFQASIAAMTEIEMKNVDIHEYSNVGKGCWIVALWSGGTASVLWDGNVHVDLNTFLSTENAKALQQFKDLFSRHFPFLNVVLHDEQPRGYGRVINFQKDIEEGVAPHWS